jgi:hypothetical protein
MRCIPDNIEPRRRFPRASSSARRIASRSISSIVCEAGVALGTVELWTSPGNTRTRFSLGRGLPGATHFNLTVR